MENKNENENQILNENSSNERKQNAKLFSKDYFKQKTSREYLVTGLKTKWKGYVVFFSVIAVLLILDLVTKSLFDLKTYDFLKGFVSIDGNHHNTGAGFSIFSNATTFLLVFSILCLIAHRASNHQASCDIESYAPPFVHC